MKIIDMPTQKISNGVKNYVICGLMVLALVLPAAAKAQTANLEELTSSLLKQIELLKQQIAELQTQVLKVEQQVQEIITFTKTLRKGVTDEEVKRLQEFLKTDPEVYPEGLVTGYYGSLTEKAVKKFQEKHAEDVLKPLGLSEGTGVVGPKTIETMNKVLEEAGKSGKVPPGLLRATEETITTSNEEKITICHIPPENPDNRQTITIGKSALPAHLAHSDIIGACNILQQPTTAALDNFAGCLTERGVILYGISSCQYCQKQRDLFGESFKYIKYVECSNNTQPCQEKGITAYPTWTLSDGNKLQGVQDLVTLAKYTGCALFVPTPVPTPTPVACTMDAKLCPDGSYVSRIAPKCEFALCPTRPAALYSINVISPNGGETWTTGSTQYIRWSTNIPITYKIMTIRLRDSLGVEYNLLADTINDGIEQVPVPTTLASGNYTLEIKTIAGGETVFDKSDSPFNIVNPTTLVPATPSADVTPPVISNIQVSQGETTNTSACMTVTWNTNEVSNSKLVYANHTLANQTNFMTSAYNNYDIVSHRLSGCSLSFGVLYYFKIYSTDAAGNTAESGEQTFTPVAPVSLSPSVAPFITVLSPNGGETWYMGKTYDILWKSSGVERVNIEVLVFKDNISVGNLSIAGSDMITPASTGKYSWTPNSQHLKEGNQFKIVIRDAKTPVEGISNLEDESDSYFSIVETSAPASTVFLPDLEPFNLTPLHSYANESNSISANFKNIGTAVLSQSFVIKYYVDGNYVGGGEAKVWLPPSSSGGSNTSVGVVGGYTFPTPGNYEIKAVLDANNAIPEIYEANNTITRTIYIRTPAQTSADLTIGYMYPSHHYANQLNYIHTIVGNGGAVVIPKGFIVKFYVDGNYVGEQMPSDLLPGTSINIIIPYVFVGSGTHEVKVVVDEANVVVESSDENNTFTQTMGMR